MASFGPVLVLLLCFCSAAFAEIITWDCKHDSPIASAQMSANIDVVLAQLASNTAKNDGLSTASFGKRKDTVHGLAQCRKDVNTSDCSACIHDAAKSIRENCYYDFNSTDERIFYDKCLMRYSDQKFFGQFDPSTYINLPYGDKGHKDLSASTCGTCLKTGFGNFPKLCRKEKTKGCRLQYGSCYLRYDTDLF
ncbi:OLC1v1006636C1 [Oldenlandia corymbosa var. corymbosa]|uniref:OLC1v1006636C1 n=1 Tax=Oldenlandia corymbosa var. corymbosa TaxID=529605 RepID=A0AAV1DJW8_OLDCO|nr:OLC1v1006636C1 [Oldenlandia corymbosa var. corymbosa]